MLDVSSRERLLLGAGLTATVILSWAWLAVMAWEMSGMDSGGAMVTQTPVAQALLSLFLMWTVMMAAMMLPSAAPMIFLYLSVNQKRAAAGRATVSTWLFVAGYLIVWAAYSALATVIQWGLRETAMLSGTMQLTSPLLISAVLIAAGLFQWSPLKHRCLTVCRSPLSFLMSRWREGRPGALIMGASHGSYCVGCCWLLMALLFVAGVMNLFWVAVIAFFVLLEKLAPNGELIGRLTGSALVILGVVLATGQT